MLDQINANKTFDEYKKLLSKTFYLTDPKLLNCRVKKQLSNRKDDKLQNLQTTLTN